MKLFFINSLNNYGWEIIIKKYLVCNFVEKGIYIFIDFLGGRELRVRLNKVLIFLLLFRCDRKFVYL